MLKKVNGPEFNSDREKLEYEVMNELFGYQKPENGRYIQTMFKASDIVFEISGDENNWRVRAIFTNGKSKLVLKMLKKIPIVSDFWCAADFVGIDPYKNEKVDDLVLDLDLELNGLDVW